MSDWNNIGLKVGGRSESTMWLDEFVLRDELVVAQADSEVYTAEQLLIAINAQRTKLIDKIDTKNAENEEMVEDEQPQAEEA